MEQKDMRYARREVEGDTLTPIAIYRRLPGERKFLLESAEKGTAGGRYSFIGSQPIGEYRASGTAIEHTDFRTGMSERWCGHSVRDLKHLFPYRAENGAPFPFFGGAVGYVGYDVLSLEEAIGVPIADEIGMPDVHLLFYDTFIAYDHERQKAAITAIDLFGGRSMEDMEAAVDALASVLAAPSPPECAETASAPLAFQYSLSKPEFCALVERIQAHIARGDVFQTVLSQRLKAPFSGDSFSFYRRLRTANPSPYMFHLALGDCAVLGASPESLVRVSGRTAVSNPIAGTRPRGATEAEDRALETELLSDEKELAEHRMLVDLSRNDLGKVCAIGSIRLTKHLAVEKYKRVMHIVSEVEGELAEGAHPLDALIACLPAGTVSGAPKLRAMQLIQSLEAQKRGVYGGAVGYLSSTGELDFALAIRMMIVKDGTAYVQAGAGIVYDSIPESEYEETLHKARAILEVGQ